MAITTEHVEEFKDRMHITHSIEDDNLKRMLSSSESALKDACGSFELEDNDRAKELVYERSRYVYNDALEYFNDNFLSEIVGLGLSIALEKGDYDEKE